MRLVLDEAGKDREYVEAVAQAVAAGADDSTLATNLHTALFGDSEQQPPEEMFTNAAKRPQLVKEWLTKRLPRMRVRILDSKTAEG